MRIRDIARIGGFSCGEYNAVTDVKGVRVGHSTVIKDGAGPVEGIARTGVSAAVSLIMILPPILVFLFSQSNVMQTMSTSGIKD